MAAGKDCGPMHELCSSLDISWDERTAFLTALAENGFDSIDELLEGQPSDQQLKALGLNRMRDRNMLRNRLESLDCDRCYSGSSRLKDLMTTVKSSMEHPFLSAMLFAGRSLGVGPSLAPLREGLAIQQFLSDLRIGEAKFLACMLSTDGFVLVEDLCEALPSDAQLQDLGFSRMRDRNVLRRRLRAHNTSSLASGYSSDSEAPSQETQPQPAQPRPALLHPVTLLFGGACVIGLYQTRELFSSLLSPLTRFTPSLRLRHPSHKE
mmetsp:Transcript_34831/g.79445  ORF Transcript_34831/g.79445 Transcript_34831/m.79445 type:complete len:265 (+) Transcript_34831:97-891(+)